MNLLQNLPVTRLNNFFKPINSTRLNFLKPATNSTSSAVKDEDTKKCRQRSLSAPPYWVSHQQYNFVSKPNLFQQSMQKIPWVVEDSTILRACRQFVPRVIQTRNFSKPTGKKAMVTYQIEMKHRRYGNLKDFFRSKLKFLSIKRKYETPKYKVPATKMSISADLGVTKRGILTLNHFFAPMEKQERVKPKKADSKLICQKHKSMCVEKPKSDCPKKGIKEEKIIFAKPIDSDKPVGLPHYYKKVCVKREWGECVKHEVKCVTARDVKQGTPCEDDSWKIDSVDMKRGREAMEEQLRKKKLTECVSPCEIEKIEPFKNCLPDPPPENQIRLVTIQQLAAEVKQNMCDTSDPPCPGFNKPGKPKICDRTPFIRKPKICEPGGVGRFPKIFCRNYGDLCTINDPCKNCKKEDQSEKEGKKGSECKMPLCPKTENKRKANASKCKLPAAIAKSKPKKASARTCTKSSKPKKASTSTCEKSSKPKKASTSTCEKSSKPKKASTRTCEKPSKPEKASTSSSKKTSKLCGKKEGAGSADPCEFKKKWSEVKSKSSVRSANFNSKELCQKSKSKSQKSKDCQKSSTSKPGVCGTTKRKFHTIVDVKPSRSVSSKYQCVQYSKSSTPPKSTKKIGGRRMSGSYDTWNARTSCVSVACREAKERKLRKLCKTKPKLKEEYKKDIKQRQHDLSELDEYKVQLPQQRPPNLEIIRSRGVSEGTSVPVPATPSPSCCDKHTLMMELDLCLKEKSECKPDVVEGVPSANKCNISVTSNNKLIFEPIQGEKTRAEIESEVIAKESPANKLTISVTPTDKLIIEPYIPKLRTKPPKESVKTSGGTQAEDLTLRNVCNRACHIKPPKEPDECTRCKKFEVCRDKKELINKPIECYKGECRTKKTNCKLESQPREPCPPCEKKPEKFRGLCPKDPEPKPEPSCRRGRETNSLCVQGACQKQKKKKEPECKPDPALIAQPPKEKPISKSEVNIPKKAEQPKVILESAKPKEKPISKSEVNIPKKAEQPKVILESAKPKEKPKSKSEVNIAKKTEQPKAISEFAKLASSGPSNSESEVRGETPCRCCKPHKGICKSSHKKTKLSGLSLIQSNTDVKPSSGRRGAHTYWKVARHLAKCDDLSSTPKPDKSALNSRKPKHVFRPKLTEDLPKVEEMPKDFVQGLKSFIKSVCAAACPSFMKGKAEDVETEDTKNCPTVESPALKTRHAIPLNKGDGRPEDKEWSFKRKKTE